MAAMLSGILCSLLYELHLLIETLAMSNSAHHLHTASYFFFCNMLLLYCGIAAVQVTQLRPRELLPYLIPRLITRPIPPSHARALGAVAQVASLRLLTDMPATADNTASYSVKHIVIKHPNRHACYC
jgi:hypothetical protein